MIHRQHPTSAYATVILNFIRLVIPGEPPMIYGDGRVVRDVAQIDNVAAYLAPAASPDVASSSVCASNWPAVPPPPLLPTARWA